MSSLPREPVCKFCGDKDCWYGACRAPAPSADKHRFDVFRICDAYESGIGHGLKRDGLYNPYPPASDDFRAYEIGYEEGTRRAIDDESQALAKASAEPAAADAMRELYVDFRRSMLGRLENGDEVNAIDAARAKVK